jgi:integrase
MARELPDGIRKEEHHGKTGYRALQWVPWWPGYPKGRLLSKRFPIDTPIATMAAWREDQKVDARHRQTAKKPLPILVTGFAEDAERYLEARQTMPQFEGRKYHIRLWVELFGERNHTTIEPVEILRQREEWLTRGPKWVQTKSGRMLKPLPLSPQEVNLRLRALENMWSTLWPKEENPVKEVDECGDAAKAQPRGQSFALCYEVRDCMPDLTTPERGGAAEIGSLSRIRFEVMFLTGLEPKQIGRLEEGAVNYQVPSIVLPLRLKGQSNKRRKRPRRIVRARPLLEAALPALRRLFELRANKPFSASSLGQSLQRAIKAANVIRAAEHRPLLEMTLRLKDWTRHTFGTELYRRTGDLKVVAEFLGHSDISQAEIYAEAALQEHMITAAAKLSAVAIAAQDPHRSAIGQTIAAWRRPVGERMGKETVPVKPSSDRSPRLVKRKNTQ